MKLALGTVQFGQTYGLTNRFGQTPPDEVARIIKAAQSFGVNVIDTARLYGDAEAVLGRSFPPRHGFKVVSKTPKFAGLNANTAVGRLTSGFEESCRALQADTLYGLLAHDADDLLGAAGDALWRRMSDWRARGLVMRIGASVYRAEQIDALLARYPLDLVQLPLNLVDQRLIAGGQIAWLYERGVEIHARSIFLQGALLQAPNALPAHLAGLRPYLARIHHEAARLNLSVMQYALGFAGAQKEISALVCGVETYQQFKELCLAARSVAALPLKTFAEAAQCACNEPQLVDPAQWPRQ